MKVIGTCGKLDRYTVKWYEGDRIVVETVGVRVFTNTRNIEEVKAICNRNLIDFKAV